MNNIHMHGIEYAEMIDHSLGVTKKTPTGTSGLTHVLFYTTKARDKFIASLPAYRQAKISTIARSWDAGILAEMLANKHVTIIRE